MWVSLPVNRSVYQIKKSTIYVQLCERSNSFQTFKSMRDKKKRKEQPATLVIVYKLYTAHASDAASEGSNIPNANL